MKWSNIAAIVWIVAAAVAYGPGNETPLAYLFALFAIACAAMDES